MKKPLISALWLLILVVGLPQLSETIYTPSLPDIASALAVSDTWVEYTLTIYLFGFGIGTLFWGKLSDHFGRKPCLLAGLLIYVLGCAACFFSTSIAMLMWSRFLQAFGGSVGSVLGQAICRDAFQGSERGKVYSTIGSALAVSPAIGPIIGGVIAQALGWSAIFVVLIILGVFVLVASYVRLPETHNPSMNPSISLRETLFRMRKDPTVMAFAFLVAACNGIIFSYYAEGSFYLIDLLGLTPSLYGLSFLGIAIATMLGGYLSRRMHNFLSSLVILGYGICVVLLGTTLFWSLILLFSFMQPSSLLYTALTLISMMFIMTGIGIMIPNVLSLALEEYKNAVGTASALFGFFYYILISLFTFGMGSLHNDTLFPMPFYFAGIGFSMYIVYKAILEKKKDK